VEINITDIEAVVLFIGGKSFELPPIKAADLVNYFVLTSEYTRTNS